MREWKNKLHFGGNYTLYQEGGEMRAYKEAEFSHLTFNPEEYDNDVDNMWEDVIELQKMLLRTGNTVRVRQEDDLVIVEWTHDNSRQYFGGTYLEFLTEDEIDFIDGCRREDCGAIKGALKPEMLNADEN